MISDKIFRLNFHTEFRYYIDPKLFHGNEIRKNFSAGEITMLEVTMIPTIY